MAYEVGDVTCVESDKGCTATVKNHRWGRVKADGWFFTKELPDDKGYCPEHNPPWVAEWRAKKKQARPKDGTVMLVAECVGCKGDITKSVGEEHTWIHEDTGEVKCGGTD